MLGSMSGAANSRNGCSSGSSDSNSPPEPQPTFVIPDEMPYNLMTSPTNASYVDVNTLDKVVLALDARARHAEVVYSENNSSVIGFDVKVRGKPLFMAPMFANEQRNATIQHSALFVDLPVTPQGWENAKTSLSHQEKKFTKRENFMLNRNSDLLFKFRNPSADFHETAYVVNKINTVSGLSINGITKITNFNVVADKSQQFFNQAFDKGTHSKAVLEAEYETISLKRNKRKEFTCLAFYLGILLPLIALIITILVLAKHSYYKWSLALLYLAITFLELIVWGGIIF